MRRVTTTGGDKNGSCADRPSREVGKIRSEA